MKRFIRTLGIVTLIGMMILPGALWVPGQRCRSSQPTGLEQVILSVRQFMSTADHPDKFQLNATRVISVFRQVAGLDTVLTPIPDADPVIHTVADQPAGIGMMAFLVFMEAYPSNWPEASPFLSVMFKPDTPPPKPSLSFT